MKPLEPLKKKSPTILVVDDEDNVRVVIRTMLEAQGWIVDEAKDGVSALEKITAALPDLILSDILMLGMNGYQLCEAAKQKYPDQYVPVILMTGYLDMTTHEKALAAGVDEYLEKPIVASLLTTRIHSLLKTKGLYEKVQNDLRELLGAEKLKENLIQMMAHDMKNPITAIRGYSELLLMSRAELPEEMSQEYLRKIIQSTEKVMRMIMNFLDISHMESAAFSLNLSQFDVKAQLEGIIDKIAPLLKKAQKDLILQVVPGGYFIEADKDLIERVMVNLIDNAVKYAPPATEIKVSLTLLDSSVQVSVEDQGAGIPQEFQEKIFEKFNRVGKNIEPFKTDTGIGLAFCKMAVEMHHGKIWVSSSVGKGSCFFISLPMKQLNKEAVKSLSEKGN